jgi:hypothetical protein
MKITEIYKEKFDHIKEMPFRDGKVNVKLFLKTEGDEFGEMVLDSERWDEFLAKSIYEDGKTIFDAGNIACFANMPNAHKKELMEVITIANGGSASFEEKKSN